MNGSAEGNRALATEQETHLSLMRGNTMKKIEIRKTGPVRLTSAAHPLYGGVCVIRLA
jgi:hypothetical protein